MEHRLRRDVHREAVAVEAGDGGVRLEAGVLIGVPVRKVSSTSSGFRASRALGDPVPRLLCLLREGRGRSADVSIPGRRRRRALRDVAGLLAVGFLEHDRRIGLARGIQPDHRRQAFAG